MAARDVPAEADITERAGSPAGRRAPVADESGRVGRILVALGGLVLICFGLHQAASIINTLVLTLTLTLAISPVLLARRRRGWPAWAAVLGGLPVVAGIALVFVVLELVSLSRLDDNLALYLFLLLYAFGEVFVMPARLRHLTGGDPATAARAVLQTGEYDFAPFLQLEADLFDDLANSASTGDLLLAPRAGVEMLRFSQANPNVEIDGER